VSARLVGVTRGGARFVLSSPSSTRLTAALGLELVHSGRRRWAADIPAPRMAPFAARATWRELVHSIRTVIIGAAAVITLIAPAGASAATYTPSQPGPLAPNSYHGSVTASPQYWHASADGPVGYARMVYRPPSPWTFGETHSFGGRFLLSSARGYVNLIRADNYATFGRDGYVFGLARYNGDHLGHLVVGSYAGVDQQIGPAFAIPVGSWFDVRVTITIGSSISVSVNGVPVAGGSYYAPRGMARITAVRSGVVATGNPGEVDVRQQNFAVDE
jgi:hypothetical protein